MGKSTLILIALAALGIGALVGVSLVDEPQAVTEPAVVEEVAVAFTGGAPVFRYLAPGDVTVGEDEFGQPLPAADGENFIAREGGPRSETLTINLGLDETVEYKALMQQGDAITFRWSTDGGDVYYDFHAHDDAFGPEFFTRYDEGEGSARSGTIVAPYAGQHGWFWLNIADGPTTVTLEVSGFYDEIIEIDLEGY
jgi:hypothetical protein